jgi:hypothetical protein
MKLELDPLAADREFFTALLSGSAETLDRILTEDFILIDVMRGGEITRDALLTVIASGQLKFETIEPAEVRVRLYQATAVVTGRTQMSGRFGETPFATRSRYTHVYVEQRGQWRLAAAQGTQIAPE